MQVKSDYRGSVPTRHHITAGTGDAHRRSLAGIKTVCRKSRAVMLVEVHEPPESGSRQIFQISSWRERTECRDDPAGTEIINRGLYLLIGLAKTEDEIREHMVSAEQLHRTDLKQTGLPLLYRWFPTRRYGCRDSEWLIDSIVSSVTSPRLTIHAYASSGEGSKPRNTTIPILSEKAYCSMTLYSGDQHIRLRCGKFDCNCDIVLGSLGNRKQLGNGVGEVAGVVILHLAGDCVSVPRLPWFWGIGIVNTCDDPFHSAEMQG